MGTPLGGHGAGHPQMSRPSRLCPRVTAVEWAQLAVAILSLGVI
jgi:hypothetical protein